MRGTFLATAIVWVLLSVTGPACSMTVDEDARRQQRLEALSPGEWGPEEAIDERADRRPGAPAGDTAGNFGVVLLTVLGSLAMAVLPFIFLF